MGLLLGSFTNVLIVRVPRGDSWVNERSACPNCHAPIRWFDNVPVISWLVLGGRCRDCRKRISARYPLVEVLVAVLTAGILHLLGATLIAALLAFLAVVTVALVFIDIDVRRLPHIVVVPSLIVCLVLATAAHLVHPETSIIRGLIGAVALGGFYGALWIVYPRGMGFGDVTTATLLGLVLGLLGWSHLAVGAIAGPLLGGVVVLTGLALGIVKRKSTVPYGPFLISGAWLGILAGPEVARIYLIMLGVTPGA